MILSQTKIFKIFTSAVQLGNISKILTNNCDREMLKYIPKRELWISRLYFVIANQKDYSCLTIDCGKSGPAKYRPITAFSKPVFLVKKRRIGCLTSLLHVI